MLLELAVHRFSHIWSGGTRQLRIEAMTCIVISSTL
jgi:hypothetical protein